MTVEIPLTKGYVAIVDDEDADLAELKWHSNDTGSSGKVYASRWDSDTQRSSSMHRVIMARILGRRLIRRELVDHVDNGNGLNNTRANLRIATVSQNRQNSKCRSDNKSGYKGVTWHHKAKRWQAVIYAPGNRLYLGLFDDPALAHEAYKAKAYELYGEFARFE